MTQHPVEHPGDGYVSSMVSAEAAVIIPKWEPFARSVQERRPDAGTWCEAWTVRDVVVHQAGNAEELVMHRWDIAGDDATAQAALGEGWMTDHSVVAVGRPLLMRGSSGLDLGPDDRVEGRLRVPGTDDIVVTATAEGNGVDQAAPEGPGHHRERRRHPGPVAVGPPPGRPGPLAQPGGAGDPQAGAGAPQRLLRTVGRLGD